MDSPRGGAAIINLDPGSGGSRARAESLSLRIARLALLRLRRARRALLAFPAPGAGPQARAVFDAMAATLGALPPETRVRVLTGTDGSTAELENVLLSEIKESRTEPLVGGGRLEITVDGRLAFSKKTIGRFPTDEEIAALGAGGTAPP